MTGKSVAVVDIGMTNKKVAVYDGGLCALGSTSRTFDPILEGGFEAHDLRAIEGWIIESLADLGRSFEIGAVAVTTHGATMVCVGEDGSPCAPCVYYTHEPGPDFQERFYALAGDRRELQAVTGTPPLSAMINPAKGLFFLRERFPESFARTRLALNYPQYWVYRLTGAAGAEGTFVGCHSYLWDWKAGRYSSVAEKLGVAGKMPFPLRDSWDVAGRLRPEIADRARLGRDVVVTMGIHDSNASLLPHLAARKGGDFALNSTGTWCVLMHPQEEYRFSPDELGKVVFFNRSAYNKPVKTAIFLGGMEFGAWADAIRASRGLAEGEPLPEPSPADYRAVVDGRDLFILPELVPGSGQFPGSVARARSGGVDYALADIGAGAALPASLRDPVASVAALKLSLAIQTLVALERAGAAAGTDVITEGGFRKNAGYNALLATALGGRAYLTDIPEATSLGAAMTAVAALEGAAPDELADRLDVSYARPAPIEGLDGFDGYRATWLALASKERP
jgi:L-fuculokinase